jgi:hypothetical protein
MRKPFSFKEQFAKGKAAEAAFLRKHPGLIPLSGRKGEYFIRLTMEKVELKTDFYRLSESPNCFLEMAMEYGGVRRKSGVHQAVEHNCNFLVYWFVEDDVELWFNPVTLRDFVLEWARLRPDTERPVKNVSDQPPHEPYYAHGFPIPRAALSRIVLPSPLGGNI